MCLGSPTSRWKPHRKNSNMFLRYRGCSFAPPRFTLQKSGRCSRVNVLLVTSTYVHIQESFEFWIDELNSVCLFVWFIDWSDVLCGQLHCTSTTQLAAFSSSLLFDYVKSNITVDASVTYGCDSVIIDVGMQQLDQGLVPNGAKCGEGRVCINCLIGCSIDCSDARPMISSRTQY